MSEYDPREHFIQDVPAQLNHTGKTGKQMRIVFMLNLFSIHTTNFTVSVIPLKLYVVMQTVDTYN